MDHEVDEPGDLLGVGGAGRGAQHQGGQVLAGVLAVRGGDRREAVGAVALRRVADGEVVPGELRGAVAGGEGGLGQVLGDRPRVGDQARLDAVAAVLPPLRQIGLVEAEPVLGEERLAVLAEVEVVEVHDAEVAGVPGDLRLVVDGLQRLEVLVPGPAPPRLHARLREHLLVDDQGHRVGADRDAELLAVDLPDLDDAGAEVIEAQVACFHLGVEVEENASLVVLPKKSHGILENVRGISAGGLRLELLPERLIRLEVRFDLDGGILLLEERDGPIDLLGPLLGTPPRVTDRHRAAPGATAPAAARRRTDAERCRRGPRRPEDRPPLDTPAGSHRRSSPQRRCRLHGSRLHESFQVSACCHKLRRGRGCVNDSDRNFSPPGVAPTACGRPRVGRQRRWGQVRATGRTGGERRTERCRGQGTRRQPRPGRRNGTGRRGRARHAHGAGGHDCGPPTRWPTGRGSGWAILGSNQ